MTEGPCGVTSTICLPQNARVLGFHLSLPSLPSFHLSVSDSCPTCLLAYLVELTFLTIPSRRLLQLTLT